MILIYNISIRLYKFLIVFASLFNNKAKLWISGRKNIWDKLANDFSKNERIIWIHAASLGEFEQGRPLIEYIKEKHPNYKILLTFFSPSGYELRKNYEKADFIYYLPLDTKRNAKKFLKVVNPEKAIFIKYEFWFHYINQLHKNNIPTYIISAIFRKSQPFFKNYGRWFVNILRNYDFLFVQNDASAKLLKSIGIENVEITGDTRFDRVYEIVEKSEDVEIVDKFKKNEILLIGGSTWQEDEEILAKYYNESNKKFKLIIAPHEIKKSNIDRLTAQINGKVELYTEATSAAVLVADVLIVNTIGILSKIYKYGDIAFIGGAFGKGLHNTLEAAAFGIPVIFGKNYNKFQEAVDMVKLGSAHSVENYEEAKKMLDLYIENKSLKIEKGEINRNYIKSSLGSTLKIAKKIFQN